MIRKIVFITIMSLGVLSLHAQKKEMQEAKAYLKSGQNLEKAETLLRGVLSMEGQAAKIDAHLLLADVLRKQYETANEKLYLRTLKDTASVFPVLRRMFDAYESLDSVDAMPDSKGRVQPRYRRKNVAYLMTFRPNLYTGGLYSYHHGKLDEAISCMESYIDCARQPLFYGTGIEKQDSMLTMASYWALMAARRLKDYSAMKRYEDRAQDYRAKRHLTIAMLYESALEEGDTLRAVRYLRKGFDEHSEHPYFFPRLIDYYTSHNQIDTVSAIVAKALDKEPGNMFYRLARNIVQLNTGRYDECIALGDSLIHLHDKLAEAYYNVGSAYFNKAVKRDKEGLESRQKRQEVNTLYEKAMPYLERYRTLRQHSEERWAPMLYTVYLNLNRGKEFDEIDKIMNAKAKKRN